MKFELNQKELEKLEKWQEAIKIVYGKYGSYKYSFSPDGINSNPSVYSNLANVELDLNDVDVNNEIIKE